MSLSGQQSPVPWAEVLPGGLGERATLVQFSSAFCAPCRVARRLLGDVAGTVPGVRHVEIDAESQLDLVRRAGIETTPTVLVLDATGTERTRTQRLPTRREVYAALGRVVRDPRERPNVDTDVR